MMNRNSVTDPRRLAAAVDRLDAVSAPDRQAAAKHVFDVCVYHVSRVRKSHPQPPHHPQHHHLAASPNAASPIISPSTASVSPDNQPTPQYVFDAVHPHVYRIARRLDRAMRYAETSPHPADAAALIVAVDAQGALAALFAVAQNAGVNPTDLDALAGPLRKRSAPALLRTLFSPDMRVANAAKKALRQVLALASCQTTPWITTIRSALSLRTATRIGRSIQLRNLLARLADILHLVVRQAATTRKTDAPNLPRKRSSRSSLGHIIVRPRPSLASERRAAERFADAKDRHSLRDLFRRKSKRPLGRVSSRATIDTDPLDRFVKRRFNRSDPIGAHRPMRGDSAEDWQSVASALLSTGGSCPGSIFSSVTESVAPASASRSQSHAAPRRAAGTVKRDAATAMYIFERLLSKRTNPDLGDRIQVLSALAEIAVSTFSGQYAISHKIDNPDDYVDAMAAIFSRHGQRIYSVMLDILFRPVRDADANRIGIFSFHEAGIMNVDVDPSYVRRKLTEFPQSAICLPNMDCNNDAAASCNSLMKLMLRFVPKICSQRMSLLTGTINSAFLHCSEALIRASDSVKWDTNKITRTVEGLSVLVAAIPLSVDSALDLIIREPVTLRLVIETCIRSVSATGRLLAQNAARYSAPKMSDEGTLDSLRSWQALINILPGTSAWSGTPSYSSSILFLAQVARRAALISVIQGHRKNRYVTTRPGRNSSAIDDSYALSPMKSESGTDFVTPIDEEGIEKSTQSTSSYGAGFEMDDENVLASELHRSVVVMINIPGTSPGDIFFELYRTVVYLYANDLKKQAKSMLVTNGNSNGGNGAHGSNETIRKTKDPKIVASEHGRGRGMRISNGSRTQSDEDAKGVLVENIAVDGQLPSRALRRAVMASELDLGEYFDIGQPPSLQHLNHEYSGVPIGLHTFEEFAHALAIIISTLSNKMITNNFENPEEAATMIARDVQRSGSSYLKKVHKRARAIMRREFGGGEGHDWRSVRYEERIRRLEDQVASLKSLIQTSLEGGSSQISRRKSLPKILGFSSNDHHHYNQRSDRVRYENDDGDEVHEIVCGPSRCFCVG